MLKETGRGKSQFTIRDLLADGRCSQAVLDFLSTTDVGRRVPAEVDAGSEASEWELRERREREEEREAEVLGRSRYSCLRPPSWRPQTKARGRVALSLLFLSFVSHARLVPFPL